MKKCLKKIGNWILNNKLALITFIAALFIINFIYAIKNVTPFGGKSLLCVDFFHQYGPMLGELHDRLRTGSNLIYSFSMGLGLPFFRNFLNYLSSPFNIILLFFSKTNLLTSYSIIIGAKAVFSCVFMAYFLKKKFNQDNEFLVPLALLYGFSSYFIAYYWNIMWLDGMTLLPLIVLGIENIVNKKKCKLYIISLAIMLFANYFIAYMICIYSVVYFLIYNILKTKFKGQKPIQIFDSIMEKSLLFFGSSLVAGMLVAFALVPLAKSLSSISATGGTIPTTQYYAFEFKDYIKSHLSGSLTTTFASDSITPPNISCGILSIALLVAFFLNIDIKWKQKIGYLLILGFIIFAFFNPQMDYVFHAFHVPNDLPYRYSFLYSFTLIIICAYSLTNLKKVKYPLLLTGYFFLMFVLLSFSFEEWDNITTNFIYINMILLTLYFIFFSANRFIPSYKKVFTCALILITVVDVIVAIDRNWDITQEIKNFYNDYNITNELLDYASKTDKEEFYRIEEIDRLTLNDPSWYGYNGINTFSSMAYESMANLQKKLGNKGNDINSYYYTNQTIIYDLMFDLKYTIGKNTRDSRYETIYSNTKDLVKYNNTVSLAYAVNDSILNWAYNSGTPFDIQNDYIYKSTGIESVLEAAEIKEKSILYDQGLKLVKYTIKNPGSSIYLYIDNSSVDFFVIDENLYYIDSNYSERDTYNLISDFLNVYNYDEKSILSVYSEDKETIDLYVSYNYYNENDLNIYTINDEKFDEAYNRLNNQKLNITSYKETSIKGNIDLEDDSIIYTSIPYDEGWHVYVDGKEVKTDILADTLLVFSCAKGKHNIKIVYKIPYFKISLLISITTLLLFIFNKKIKNWISKKGDILLDKLILNKKSLVKKH